MTRRDTGSVQLTERDLRALAWVGEQWIVRMDHLTYVLGMESDPEHTCLSVGAVRQVVIRWQRAGWVRMQKIFTNQPPWIWLTKEGLATAGLPYREWVPKAPDLAHMHAVNAVRIWIETEDRKQGQRGRWVSERRLRWAEHQDGLSPRTRSHLPDAEVQYGAYVAAIEVERSVKKVLRLVNIMGELVRKYQGVFYFITADTAAVVRRAHAELGSPEQIRIVDGWTVIEEPTGAQRQETQEHIR